MGMVTVFNPQTNESIQIDEQEAIARGAQPSDEYQVKKAFNEQQQPQVRQPEYGPLVQKLGGLVDKNPALAKGLENFVNSKYMQVPESFARGALQGGGDMFASLANLINKPINYALGTEYNQPHPDFKEGAPRGALNKLAFLGGEIGSGLAAGGATRLPGALQAIQRVPRPGGYLGLASDALLGAGSGYALGENEKGERGLATILGGILGPVASITNRGITNRVLRDRERELARHGQAYEQIFDAAEQNGTPFIAESIERMGNQQGLNLVRRLMNRLPVDNREALVEFFQNPSFRNAQNLQSELGKWTRAVEGDRRYKTRTLPGRLQRAYEAAVELRDGLRSDITHSLAQGGLIQESLLYPRVTQSYAENVAPYFTQSISDVMQGKKMPEKLAKRLADDEQFMLDLGHVYPEISINKFLTSSKAKKAAMLGAGLLGLNKIAGAEEKGKEKEPFFTTASGQKFYRD